MLSFLIFLQALIEKLIINNSKIQRNELKLEDVLDLAESVLSRLETLAIEVSLLLLLLLLLLLFIIIIVVVVVVVVIVFVIVVSLKLVYLISSYGCCLEERELPAIDYLHTSLCILLNHQNIMGRTVIRY